MNKLPLPASWPAPWAASVCAQKKQKRHDPEALHENPGFGANPLPFVGAWSSCTSAELFRASVGHTKKPRLKGYPVVPPNQAERCVTPALRACYLEFT